MLALPLFVVAVIGLSLALASTLWAFGADQPVGVAAVTAIAVPAAIGVAALVAVRGCFVDVDASVVRDVVAWRTMRRVPTETIAAARVRRGVWRLYVLELDDGTTVKLAGASPQQFPAWLLPDATQRDLVDLDVLLGAPSA